MKKEKILEIRKEDITKLSLLLSAIEKPMKIHLVLCLYASPRLTEKEIAEKLRCSSAILGVMLKSLLKWKLAVKKGSYYELTGLGRKAAEVLLVMSELAKKELKTQMEAPLRIKTN